ncbi:MAG: hypothetical protein ACOYNO_10930, partial [Saprospiraceae bacterium]
MNGIPPQLQKRIDEGYEFNFGEYINRGLNLVQQEIGLFIGFTLLYFVISATLGTIPFFGSLVSWLVITPVGTLAFYIAGHKLDKGEKLEFSDFFRGFDKIGDLVMTALLSGLIVFGSLLPGMILLFTGGIMSFYSFDSDLDSLNIGLLSLGVLLMVIPAIYFSVAYLWAYPLVWFYDMKPWVAMETSRKLTGKNWLMVFLFLLVTGLIAALGIVGLIVGILFTLPLMYPAQYAAFADVTGLLEEQDETDQTD